MAAATGAITPGRSARRRANPSSRRRSKPASTSSTPPTVIRSATAKRSSVAQSRTLPAATRLSSPPRYTDACPQPARQPEAVPTSFEGQCNPRDLAAGLDRLVTPAMQQAKQPFCTRLQLLAWLALNAGKHTGNQPTRLAHLDDGNDRAILVQGDEDLLKSFGWGIRALHQLATATMVPFPRRLPHTISPLEGSGFELLVPREGVKG